MQNTVFKKFLRGRVKYKGRNFVFYSFCYRLTCSFTCCNLETSVLDSFCAKDSRNEDRLANLRVIFGPFLVHLAKITENYAQMMEVSCVKSGDIVKASIKQP